MITDLPGRAVGRLTTRVAWAVLMMSATVSTKIYASDRTECTTGPSATTEARVDCLLASMSTDDKLALVFSRDGGGFGGERIPDGALGSAAYLRLPAHLHLPTLQISDAGLGVGNPGNARKDGTATALPSGLATAATWDPGMARAGGAMIGEEAFRQGFNVLLAGGADLTRDPRGGRDFEYAGEDPLLTGRMVGSTVAGIQTRHVISTIKHFAMNDLETSRMTMSADIDPAAMRESDLLGFEIAIETGHPGSVMCSYNRVNDIYACENSALLTDALKRDWHYPGFVMSDWGATHTTVRAALAGLDQESSGDTIDARPFFGPALAQAVRDGSVPMSRLDDMAGRVLRAMVSTGLLDHPPVRRPIDVAADRAVAQRDEEEGAVLLRNEGGMLPLSRTARIVVVGGHADLGVLSGGGSSQVVPIGGNPVKGAGGPKEWPGDPVYDPSSPLRAMRAEAPGAHVDYASGDDVKKAVALVRGADAVVLFATRWSYESVDVPTLALPDGQASLITAVAQANPHVVVVLEGNGPVLMPWLNQTKAVLEAWYPGAGGGEAIARMLYGTISPSGRLPITFPQDETQLAHPNIAGVTATSVFDVQFHTDQEVEYREGSEVGYRWFDRRHETPLFAFGFGLTYTQFERSDLAVHAEPNGAIVARFTVRNVGRQAGTDVAQIYVGLPGGGGRRLAGWQRVSLAPGEGRSISVALEPRVLAQFNAGRDRWQIAAGSYRIWLAGHATDNSDGTTVKLEARSLVP